MATQPEEDELVLDTPADDQEDDQQGDQQEQQQEEQAEEEEILIGDDTLPRESDSDLIKHLRAEIKRRDSLLNERPAPAPEKIEVGERPKLEDFDWDEEKHAAAVDEWYDRRRKAEQAETQQEAGQRKASEEFQGAVRHFETKKAELKVPGAQDAIDTAIAALPQASRAAILLATKNPALVFAALGKHPGKLTEFSSIENPIKLAAEVALFEGTLKVGKRTAPPPEEVATGSARVTQERGDKEEQRLEKEADRTGDRTKLIAYRKQKKASEKAREEAARQRGK